MPQRLLGVCYYPEHWPEDKWADDARRMAETGLSLVRIGEFAWSRLEPTPGDLRFEWLDRAIETLAGAGLKVVLGTPTATPPRWMLDKHPDMLAFDRQGRPRRFGSRRHYCFSHEAYRTECARITRLLAERYGENPAIAAWQTDNEYGCHDTALSYSDAARDGFRRWLAARYGEIARLNEAWGNVFWSMEYGGFDQIDLPNLTVTEANPAHWLDFYRYSSDQVVAFNRLQVEIIRTHSDAPVLHNYMGRTVEFDHFAVGADLDIATWDSYPLGFLEDRVEADDAHKCAFLRQGDPDFQAFHHDLYRAVGRGRWWVMEQQPGPVNWAPHNPAPLPGMVRLWTWEAFAHGAEAVSYFRWRQAPMAQEQMHSGLLAPDSREASGLREAAQVAKECANRPRAENPAPPKVGLVFDYESAWAWTIQPQGRGFDYFRLVFAAYRALRQAGHSIDILPRDTDDLGAYALVVAPGVAAWSEKLRKALAAFAGIAVIGPRSGSKTAHLSIPERMPPDLPGAGIRISHVETLRPGASVALLGGGAFVHWREFAETDGEPAERTADGYPALHVAGNLRYVCGWPDDEAMTRLLGDAARDAGLDVLSLPAGLRRRQCGGETFWFNYAADPVPLAKTAGDDALPASLPGADLFIETAF